MVKEVNKVIGVIKVIGTALCLFAGMVYGQNEDCIQQLRAVYKKVNTLPSLPKAHKKIYRLSYTVKTTMRDTTLPHTTATVEALIGGERSYYKTPQMEAYSDEHTTVTVVPIRKTIYITGKTAGEDGKRKQAWFSFMQDTLFSMAKVQSCKESRLADGSVSKKVVLAFDKTGQVLFRASSITFWFDPQKEVIHKTVVKYTAESETQQVEITYHDTDYDYKTNRLNKKATAHVLTASGKLHDRYKGYEIVDVGNVISSQ